MKQSQITLIPPVGRPEAVLVDMDGTLVNVSGIRYMIDPNSNYVWLRGGDKDFDGFHQASRHAPPIEQALEFCRRHYAAGKIVAVGTARAVMHHDVSKGWLDDCLLPELLKIPRAPHLPVGYDGPFMFRQNGDRRSDVIIKREMHRYLNQHYNIKAACDDNPPICSLWEELQIPEIEIIPGWADL